MTGNNNTVKIGNDTSLYNTADSSMVVFTHNGNWSDGTPNNPNIFAARTSSKRQTISIPFRSVSPVIDYESVQPMAITITGTFYGTEKVTQLKKLARMVYSEGLKKIYINNTTFIYAYGESVSDTVSGVRSQFRDYTTTFSSPMPFVFTCNSSTYDLDSNTSVSMINNVTTSIGTIDNANYYAPNLIQRIDITVPDTGGDNLKSVEIGTGIDAANAMSGNNKIVWQNSTGVGNNCVLEIHLVYPVNHQLTLHHACLTSARTTVNGSVILKEDVIDGLKAAANNTATFYARINGNNNATTGEAKLSADYSGTACNATVTINYWKGSDYVV